LVVFFGKIDLLFSIFNMEMDALNGMMDNSLARVTACISWIERSDTQHLIIQMTPTDFIAQVAITY
jgi:hypothetical protein